MLHQLQKQRSEAVQPSRNRRGAVVVLCALLMTVVMVGIAFSVDVAYMQLTRTELQAANDAAAKAATVALAQGRNANQAKNEAIAAAARNKVAGRSLVINNNNIKLGGLRLGNNGSWDFVEGQTPLMAAQIDVNMTSNSPSGPVNLFFAPFLGSNTFSPRNTATAGFVQNAICLVLDRSHSMCFDLSGVDWVYPAGAPLWPLAYVAPPRPQGSRWATLTNSVRLFNQILNDSAHNPPVALVTWGSQINAGIWNGVRYPSFPASILDVAIGTNQLGQINSTLVTKGNNIMLGGTNMAAGMTQGRQVLVNYNPALPVNRVMILLTDGEWNAGSDPVGVANQLATSNIKCHTIGLLAGQSSQVLSRIAQITGGKFFMATDQASLDAAFREIAADLPIVLTQ